MQFFSLLIGASALIAPALAQTWTDCNPLNTTCPNNPGFGIDYLFQFNTSKTVEKSFNITNGKLSYGDQGSEFVITKRLESPTIRSKFYIHFGSISVVMKAATGQGIVSSIVVQSECLDEIDWEFLGGNGTHAQTNYFGKGNTTSYDRDVWHPVDTDVRENFHNYTVDWTKEKMDFYIDSKHVRTLMYGDANGGKNYPQTPSTVRLGVWAGGDKDNNKYTIEWAGGLTDYSKGPYTMYVQSTHVRDYGTGKEYEWTDKTGNWQSIKSIPGNSTAAEAILKVEEPQKSVSQKFQELPQTSKVAIYAGAGGGAAVIFAAFLFICLRQRRKGRAEREAYNTRIEKERQDAYHDQMELRQKGLGGWDNGARGEDALGGWQSRNTAADATPAASKVPLVGAQDAPSRMASPVSRQASPAAWSGGNQGGMIHNAHNAYNGGYGSNPNIPRSPNFPLASQGGYNSHGGFPGSNNVFGSNGGYTRF